jgi:hypothetical protein
VTAAGGSAPHHQGAGQQQQQQRRRQVRQPPALPPRRPPSRPQRSAQRRQRRQQWAPAAAAAASVGASWLAGSRAGGRLARLLTRLVVLQRGHLLMVKERRPSQKSLRSRCVGVWVLECYCKRCWPAASRRSVRAALATPHPLPCTTRTDTRPHQHPHTQVPLSRLLALNRPEWPSLLLGMLSSIVVGGVQPAFAFVISAMTTNFFTKGESDVCACACGPRPLWACAASPRQCCTQQGAPLSRRAARE